MPKLKWLLPLGFLVLSPLLASDDVDLQFWNAYNWKFYKNDKLNLNLYVENRNRDDASISFGYFVGPTLRYKVSPNLGLGAAVKMIYLKTGDSGFNKWQRTELEATYKLNLVSRLKFDHRTRHEYFFRDVGDDFQRYRSRLRFNLPLKGSRLSSFGFSNEFFYDLRTDTFAVNRLVPVSLSFKLSKRFKLSTYYMWEHRRSGSRENHILGTTLSF